MNKNSKFATVLGLALGLAFLVLFLEVRDRYKPKEMVKTEIYTNLDGVTFGNGNTGGVIISHGAGISGVLAKAKIQLPEYWNASSFQTAEVSNSYTMGKTPLAKRPEQFPVLTSRTSLFAYCIARAKEIRLIDDSGVTNSVALGTEGISAILSEAESLSDGKHDMSVVDEDGNAVLIVRREENGSMKMELPEKVKFRAEGARISEIIPKGEDGAKREWHHGDGKYLDLKSEWADGQDNKYFSIIAGTFAGTFSTSNGLMLGSTNQFTDYRILAAQRGFQ